jgi:hypothetical protein
MRKRSEKMSSPRCARSPPLGSAWRISFICPG